MGNSFPSLTTIPAGRGQVPPTSETVSGGTGFSGMRGRTFSLIERDGNFATAENYLLKKSYVTLAIIPHARIPAIGLLAQRKTTTLRCMREADITQSTVRIMEERNSLTSKSKKYGDSITESTGRMPGWADSSVSAGKLSEESSGESSGLTLSEGVSPHF